MELDLHWLRPLWLLALPLAALPWIRGRRAAGPWARVVDPQLAPFVLRHRGAQSGWRWRLAACLGLSVCLLALAGPAWRQAPQSFNRSADTLVVLLDVSRSMLAGDLTPSRLDRARLKVKESLRRRARGRTGLVAFSGHAFTVAPVTTDTATVLNLLDVLAPDIMPSRGSNVAAAIARGQRLLDQAEARQGRLLLLADSAGGQRAVDAARKLRAAGHTLLVLGAATRDGAPVPDMQGGFLRARDSGLVLSRPDEDALLRLAREGGGAYRRISADNSDLEALLGRGRTARAGGQPSDVEAQRWRDEGPLLLILLAPLAALAFRRGWVLMLLAAPLAAFAAGGWFSTSDRQGMRAFSEGDFRRAEALFEDPAWKAAALYRQGRFLAAARLLEQSPAPADRYNRATALARAGHIRTAIRLYEELLLEHPGHADARHNLAVLKQAPPGAARAAARPEETPPGGTVEPFQQDAGEAAAALADDQAALQAPMLPDQARRWLQQVPDDPGGLLRRKFQRQYRARGVDQDGRALWPGEPDEPW